MARKESRQLTMRFGPSKQSETLKQFQSRITTEFNSAAQIFRNDMNRLYTHFISIEEVVEQGAKLTASIEVILNTTERIVSIVGNRTVGMKELSRGEDREVVVEGGQKSGRGILNAFEKVKRETKKLFDGRFFRGKEFGHQDITPSGLRLAATAEALQLLEDNLIEFKQPTQRGEGRVAVPSAVIQLKKQNIAELRKVKATIQTLLIASALVEKLPMTKTLQGGNSRARYQALADLFNETTNIQPILTSEKKKFISVRDGIARIELKLENKDYNRFKSKFQSALGTSVDRIFKGQNLPTDLTKFFLKKVKIGQLRGSEAIEDKIVKDISAIAMGKKVKKQRTSKSTTSKAKKLNKNPKVNIKKQKDFANKSRRIKGLASKPTKQPQESRESATGQEDLFKLEKLINRRLPAEVRRNMGRPALQNQTGRFSNSVKLESLRQTAGGISGEYSYQLSPYETFENTGSRRWPTGYNPKPLIAKSIRNLAMAYTEQKLTSLRRT